MVTGMCVYVCICVHACVPGVSECVCVCVCVCVMCVYVCMSVRVCVSFNHGLTSEKSLCNSGLTPTMDVHDCQRTANRYQIAHTYHTPMYVHGCM